MKQLPITTIDPIDIALAEAKDDSLSHRLLAHQIDLVAAMLGLMILLAIAMVRPAAATL